MAQWKKKKKLLVWLGRQTVAPQLFPSLGCEPSLLLFSYSF
jgi:hypothetical protein